MKWLWITLFGGLAFVFSVVGPASAQDDPIWVDLDFYGASSIAGPDGSTGTRVGYYEELGVIYSIPTSEYGEEQLRPLVQRVDEYYSRSTQGRLRFRLRSWHPFAPTSDTNCSGELPSVPFVPVFPDNFISVYINASGCASGPRGGYGALGRNSTTLNQAASFVLAHEIGHNIGLLHASTRQCDLQSAGTCPLGENEVEYGVDRGIMGDWRNDTQSTMADATVYRDLDPSELLSLDVLPASRRVDFETPPARDQVVRIAAYNTGKPDVLVLRKDTKAITVAYRNDPTLAGNMPTGVEIYSENFRNEPAPLTLGTLYDGDLGYTVKVLDTQPEYAEILIMDGGEPLKKPTQPTGTLDADRVHLSWDVSLDGRSITGIEVQRASPGGTANHPWSTIPGERILRWSDSAADIESQGEYRYRVRVLTAVGATPWSDSSEVLDNVLVPGAAESVTVSPAHEAAIVRAKCPNGGGATSLTLRVRYSSDLDANPRDWAIADVPYGNGVVRGLSNGVPYGFQVACANRVGSGEYSTTVTAAPMEPPEAPIVAGYFMQRRLKPGTFELAIFLRPNPEALLNTEAISLAQEGHETNDMIKYSPWEAEDGTWRSYEVTPGETYKFFVRSMDGTGRWGPTEVLQLKALAQPTAPSDARYEDTVEGDLVTWEPSHADYAVRIEYEVTNDSGTTVICRSVETQCVVPNVDDVEYTKTIRIQAFNETVPSAVVYLAIPIHARPSPSPSPSASNWPTQEPSPSPSFSSSPGGPGLTTGPSNPIATGSIRPSTSRPASPYGTPESPQVSGNAQTIRFTKKRVHMGRRVILPARTQQGVVVKWSASPRSVCRVRAHRLLTKRTGRCSLRAFATATDRYAPIARTWKLVVRST